MHQAGMNPGYATLAPADPLGLLEEEISSPDSIQETNFRESAYLMAFPDIAQAVRQGEWTSAFDHFRRHGHSEGRLQSARYQRILNGDPPPPSQAIILEVPAAGGVDVAFTTSSGLCVVIGWIDDRSSPLCSASIMVEGQVLGRTDGIGRCRRSDAEQAVGTSSGHLLGFWLLLSLGAQLQGDAKLVLEFNGGVRSYGISPKVMSETQLRDTIFEYVASATYFGNPSVDSLAELDKGVGQQLIDLNARMSNSIAAGAHVERYGKSPERLRGSIIVCLYGKHEFMFVQAALFSVGRDWRDYEMIYVSNSPELTEVLQKEAQNVWRIYGMSLTIVFLPGNAGFGVANNVAAKFARSSRILIVNPDIFPRQGDWAERHTAVLDGLPAEETKIFGVPLFYDDGSLMHGGMFFEVDNGLSVTPQAIRTRKVLRVEHYGKGAPPDSALYNQSRRVPAISGAFISIDREWFEKLGGFSNSYVFGHYEDADLCLRSLEQEVPCWLHNIPFWHMEGKGSTRRLAHEGGSLINRWHFTNIWGDFICTSLLGRSALASEQTYLRVGRRFAM